MVCHQGERWTLADPGRSRSAEGDRRRLAALLAFDDLNDDALALNQVWQTGAHQRRAMDEHILAAALDGHKAEALSRIVPLHRPGHLFRRTAEARLALIGRATRWALAVAASAIAAPTT